MALKEHFTTEDTEDTETCIHGPSHNEPGFFDNDLTAVTLDEPSRTHYTDETSAIHLVTHAHVDREAIHHHRRVSLHTRRCEQPLGALAILEAEPGPPLIALPARQTRTARRVSLEAHGAKVGMIRMAHRAPTERDLTTKSDIAQEGGVVGSAKRHTVHDESGD